MNKKTDEENIVVNGFSLEEFANGYLEMGELNLGLASTEFKAEQEADELIEKNLVKSDYIVKAE